MQSWMCLKLVKIFMEPVQVSLSLQINDEGNGCFASSFSFICSFKAQPACIAALFVKVA